MLPFTFGSWLVALTLGLLPPIRVPFVIFSRSGNLLLRMHRIGRTISTVCAMGAGQGPDWRTATRIKRPAVYWLAVSLVFTLSAILLAAALLEAAKHPVV
jgi:hypothetical protein